MEKVLIKKRQIIMKIYKIDKKLNKIKNMLKNWQMLKALS